MPGRPLLFDLRCGNDTICRTCLLSLRQRPAPRPQQPWVAQLSSRAASGGRTRNRSRTQMQPTSSSPNASAFKRAGRADGVQQLDNAAKALEGQENESDNYEINFFEQDGNRLTELPNEEAFEQSQNGIDATILRHAFNTVGRRDEGFDEVMGQLGNSWNNMKTAEDVDKITERMKKYGEKIDIKLEQLMSQLPEDMRDDMVEKLGPLAPKTSTQKKPRRAPLPQIPEKSYTVNQRRKVSRLNQALQKTWSDMRYSSKPKSKDVSTIYKAYHAARRSLSSGWINVPLDVWDFLWSIFSADESINPHRLSHVSLLARDMADAKVALSPSQQLLIVEAVFVDGLHAKALENWKRCMPTLGDTSAETFKNFWELGVRMHTRMGDMDQAQRAVNKLIQNNSDPRIMLPVIRTFAERSISEDQERSWLAYREMRELLGQEMKLSDYDQVVSIFLTTNQVENALYAFVDMMSDGQIDMKKQKHMPSVVGNKFFVGKWLKRLIGANDLDGAYSVVEWMRSRGVQLAPVQLNGLIGAWQRSGGAKNMEKADELAWKMIQSRIDFVQARRAGKVEAPQKGLAVSLPRATRETFSVLAENYRMRELPERMDQLWDAFRDAEISPDAFMMNQLLESYVQGNQIKEAKALYTSLVTEGSVVPDPYTFSVLWKTLDVYRLHNLTDGSLAKDAVTARQLFSQMARYKRIFSADGLDEQLARRIMHAFRQLKDNAGFLVALTAMKQIFNYLPSEALVLETMIGTTRLTVGSETKRRNLMSAKMELERTLRANAGGDESRLQGESRQTALYDFLQKKFWPTDSNENWAKVFTGVAKEMGVYDALSMGGQRRTTA